jgi:hypothetical protein
MSRQQAREGLDQVADIGVEKHIWLTRVRR